MFAMDASSAADVLDVAKRDFQADSMKVNRFVVEYLKRSKEAEMAFKELSKYVEQVELVWSPKHLELGDLLDVKDSVNNWCFAGVIDTNRHDKE